MRFAEALSCQTFGKESRCKPRPAWVFVWDCQSSVLGLATLGFVFVRQNTVGGAISLSDFSSDIVALQR